LATILEFFYEFIFFSVLSENVKKDGFFYFPALFSVFIFINSCNVLGLVH